jgi:membrane fusion protein (multidrug efflux system)
VDPSNRTFPIEFQLPNPGRAVKPEMVANIEVVRRVIENALVVPQEALVRVEDGYVVFVVEDDHAVARPVTVGPSQRNRSVVTSGLQAGDRLVVVGQKQLAAGDRVRIVGES